MGEKKNFNVLEHELVPKMEIISKKEQEELFKKYNITKDKLPKMLSSDPEAKALGAKVGDVVKIIREDPHARYIYYREVI